MYLCPVCNKEFSQEELVVKHALGCWRKQYAGHSVKHAPRTTAVTREVDPQIEDFFKKGIENARSST